MLRIEFLATVQELPHDLIVKFKLKSSFLFVTYKLWSENFAPEAKEKAKTATGLNLAFRSSSIASSSMAAVCKTLRGNPAPTTFRSSFVISPWATNCSCRGSLLLRELGANSCFQRASQNLKVGTVTQVWSLWSFNMKFCSNEMRGLGFLHHHSTIQPTDMKPRLNIYLLNEPKKSTSSSGEIRT